MILQENSSGFILRSFSSSASLCSLSFLIAFSNFSEGLFITIGSFVYDILSTFDGAKIRRIWQCAKYLKRFIVFPRSFILSRCSYPSRRWCLCRVRGSRVHWRGWSGGGRLGCASYPFKSEIIFSTTGIIAGISSSSVLNTTSESISK